MPGNHQAKRGQFDVLEELAQRLLQWIGVEIEMEPIQ